MDFENVHSVIFKDFLVFRQKRSVVLTLTLLPLAIGIGFPALLYIIHSANPASYTTYIPVFNTFLFWFIILSTLVPLAVASYSMIGEKIEKTLEPLLGTPLTDGEIILGKTMAAFIPSILATYLGAVVFMILIDIISYQQLGYIFYPNWTAGTFLLVATPIACLLGTEYNFLISLRVNDIRSAQNLGGVINLPFFIVFFLGLLEVITIDIKTVLIFSGMLLVADIILFYVNRSLFQREEILTKYG